MKNLKNLNFKTLAFYGGAIAGVTILFKTITVYAESHLHPPAALKNHYLLTLAKNNLPHCTQVNPLLLKIQQSGIYVSAALLAKTDNADKIKQLNLGGLLHNGQLSLSGGIDDSILCQTSSSLPNQLQPANIQVSFTDKNHIIGQLHFQQINSPTIEFTAIPQVDQEINPQSPHLEGNHKNVGEPAHRSHIIGDR